MFDQDPFDYLNPYSVSIGSDDTTKTPTGSGTLGRFKAVLNDKEVTVYCIFAATHVLEELGLLDVLRPGNPLERKYVTISKLKDRTGAIYAAKWQVGIASEIDNKHFRFLTRNLKAVNADKVPPFGFYEHSERDVSLLILSTDSLPANDITENSMFYDLDSNPPMPLVNGDFYYVFFKSACADSETKENVLENTGIRMVLNGKTKVHIRSKIPYLSMDWDDQRTLNGSSGAGLWVFYKEDEIIKQRLCGIVVEHISTNNTLSAIDISYVTETLLPKIKKDLANLLTLQTQLPKPQETQDTP